jgi:hypothetical protein
MIHWQTYVKASWELVMEAEGRSHEYLDTELEAYLVHTMARNFDNCDNWGRPIAIRMMEAQHGPKSQSKDIMRRAGDECLFIHSWEIRQPKWPTPNYFSNMGQIAYGMAAISTQPTDDLLDAVGINFPSMSKVLRQVKNLYQPPNQF